MKTRYSTLPFLLVVSLTVLLSLGFLFLPLLVTCQTRERRVSADNTSEPPANPDNRTTTLPRARPDDVVKVDVDLVTIDALVLQKKTARVVGGLKKEDFVLFE